MFRTILKPSGNYCSTFDPDSDEDLADLKELLTDGDTIILSEDMPDDVHDLLSTANSKDVIDVSE